jgi:hypothetical protein
VKWRTGLNPPSGTKSFSLRRLQAWDIVYLPEPRPLQVVAIFHGNRAVERLLKERL